MKKNMNKNARKILFLFILLSLNSFAAVQATYFVSPLGDDDNPGTQEKPFRSLHKARDIIRTLNKSMSGNIVVNLRGGLHQLDSTVTLSSDDGGFNGNNIIYQAFENENPVVSGGIKISDWVVHDSAKNIYSAKVDTFIDTRHLYVNGNRAVRARTENAAGWTETASGYSAPSWVQSLKNITSVEVVSFKAWKCHRGPIASVSGNSVNMAQPYWQNVHWQYDAPPVWIENAYEFLDKEGEWYLDRSDGMLYYKPLANETMDDAEVFLPTLELLLKGKGVSNVHFKGLTFAHATWLEPSTPIGFACMQAEAVFTGPNYQHRQIPGNLIFNYCTNLVFEKNTFKHLGVNGLQLGMGCKYNRIYDNEFRDISSSAISLGGLWLLTNAPADSAYADSNVIDNNLVTDAAVEYYGSTGIFVGNTKHTTITHNEVRNLPYSGISAGWGWSNQLNAGEGNEIAYNAVYNVMNVLLDGGCIYTLSNQPGANVHHNVVMNQKNPYGGLYPDEGSSNMRWHHNVVLNTYRWLHIHTGSISNNAVDSNYYNTPISMQNGTNITMKDNLDVSAGNFPTEALSIINNAGRKGHSFIKNLAWLRPASYSSVYSADYAGNKGNDENTSTMWASDGTETNPWYQVELDSSYTIGKIELVARTDADQPGARTNFEIWASEASDFADYSILASKKGDAFPHGSTWFAEVDDSSSYRYIRVQRINDKGHLNFAELRVFAAEKEIPVIVKSNNAVRPYGMFFNRESGLLNFTGLSGFLSIDIYDIQGRLCIRSTESRLDVRSFNKGIYLVHINGTSKYKSRFFVKW
ncbi:MAG: right-handed parallel beta-helix repeat-containing protein [Fibrobacteria bacterium]|nr:right-handed parallel beta-helix repeat-containing protein [Fibrobacteria bacterium]